MNLLMKRNDGGLPVPLEGPAEERITRARAIKLAGAMVGTGAFALLLPDEADALSRRQRRRRRLRRRRQRRQNNVTSTNTDNGVVNFGDTTVGSPLTKFVDIKNNGPDSVTIDPTVVGSGFTLADLSGIDLTLEPGETVSIPVIVDALSSGVKTGELRILDDADGLLLETVDLVADVNVLP
jgi:hypothetical protein